MCFGSGAPAYKKPEFGALPSLRVDTSNKDKKGKAPKLKDVELTREGRSTRSLLNPNMEQDYGS